jgi:hypothetical protein
LFQLNPERPASAQLRQLRSQGVISQLEGLEDGVAGKSQRARVKVLAIVAAPGLGLLDENRILQVTQTLPPNLVANALAVELAYREYQERALARQGLDVPNPPPLKAGCSTPGLRHRVRAHIFPPK